MDGPLKIAEDGFYSGGLGMEPGLHVLKEGTDPAFWNNSWDASIIIETDTAVLTGPQGSQGWIGGEAYTEYRLSLIHI